MVELDRTGDLNETVETDKAAENGTPEETGKKKNKKQKEKKSLGQEILSWILTILAAVAIALVIRSFIFEPVRVDGHSMDDTLADGEIMFVTKFDYSSTWLSLPWQSDEEKESASRITFSGDPARFDVVICRYPGRGDTNFVKRVTGLPGDTVSFSDGYLYVNGEKQEETYINDEYRIGFKNSMDEFTVPKKGDALRIKEDGYLYVGDEPWPWSNGSISGVSSDGERLTYHQGSLLLDGKEITRSGGQYMIGGEAVDHNPIEDITGRDYYLESDMYFVCGDHRNNSNDSRSVGPIDRSMIIGHVRQVLLPFSAWRGVK